MKANQQTLSSWIVLAALSLPLVLTSCVDDSVENAPELISNIIVSGIEERYTATAYVGEVLEISPEVQSGYSESELHYRWMLLDGNTGSPDINGDTIRPVLIGEDKHLNYEVNTTPGTYQLRLEVSADNGYSIVRTASLSIVTAFSQGFYILKETAEGNTDLDLVNTSGELLSDVLAQTQGSSLQGTPLKLNVLYAGYYINPDNDEMETTHHLVVTTEKGTIGMYRTTDLLETFSRRNIKYEAMEADEKPYTVVQTNMGYGVLLTNHGIYHTSTGAGWTSSKSSGRYGYPEAETGASGYVFVDLNSYGCLAFWDEDSHSLYCTNYNLVVQPLADINLGGTEQTQNLTTYECLNCGLCTGSGVGHFILRDNATGTRYLYLTAGDFANGLYYTGCKALGENSHAARSTAYATCGLQGNYIYCVDGNKLYGINLNSETLAEVLMPLAGIDSRETITMVTNQYWSSYFIEQNNYDYLMVGTQQGNNYRLYMYNMKGGVPDGEPVATYSGTGKIKAVRFVSQEYDSNDAGFNNALSPCWD